MDLKQEEGIIKKNTLLTMLVNGLLAIMKILAGIFGRSSVLITDAINSLGDILTNIVVYISAIFSKKEEDSDHPYGHEKIDSIISIFLGVVIIVTAFEVGKIAVVKLYDFFVNGVTIPNPEWYALAAALLTIVVKELLFRKTIKDAVKAKSSALTAQAWDHRSDTVASFGASIGILGAMFGLAYLDPIASILISIFILRLGIKIIFTGVNQVVDKAADPMIIEHILEIIEKYEEVRSVDEIKTRMFGLKIYVDLEIGLDANLLLEKSHQIAEKIHDDVEKSIPGVLHCMIHVNPYYPKK
ncbi:MAG: cation transporter [Tenericutes bacterium]|nr:cation transporter [Mycoplasmatota bacterium]